MTDPVILGIDCGTQSLRAALFRGDGTRLAVASASYATACPRINWAEQNPDDWWQALCQVVPQCLAEAHVRKEAVAALAIDGTSCTAVFATEDGRPLRPALLWMDIRAAAEAQEVEATEDPALASCGGRVSPEWLLPKALWVQREEPGIYKMADRVVEGVDWLIHRLTGRWVTSNSNAAGKRHWTPEGHWPHVFYARLGLADLAAKSPDRVVYVGDTAGTLGKEAAAALGLTPACRVAHGGMDGWTAAIGKNCLGPGQASLALGTSTVVVLETAAPAAIPGIMGPFPDGLRRGRAVYEAGQTSGGSIVQWLLRLVGRDKDPLAHGDLEAAAAALPPGSDGLVLFDAWRGNRTPYFDPHARGLICGLTLEHGAAHLYRAVLEGCAYGVRNVLDTLEAGGHPVEVLRTCGSGSSNALYTAILAAVTGKPVHVCAEKDATCRGSAVCAAVAAAMHSDIEKAAAAMAPPFKVIVPGPGQEVYDACFGMYRDAYGQMKDTMHRLAALPEEA